MKRYIVAVALVALVLVAGVAFAHGDMWNRGHRGNSCAGDGSLPYMGQGGPGMYGSQGDEDHHLRPEGHWRGYSNRGRGWNNSRFPREINDKMKEIQKFQLDMRREMLEEKPDIELLKDLHGKMQKIRNEMADWHFNQYLESLNKRETSKQ